MIMLPGQKDRMRAREYHWRADIYIYIYRYIYLCCADESTKDETVLSAD